MSINLLSLLKDQMGSSAVSQIGSLLGEDASTTQKGIDAAMPSLLGGLMNKVSGSGLDGASSLLNLIKTDKHDGSLLSNMSGLFSGGESTNSLLKTGTGLLTSLFFGSRSNSMFDLIGRAAGFRNSRSSSSILGMLAPIVLNMIGKRVFSGGLDSLGLKKLLLGQKDHVKAAAPAGLASALGISSFDNIADSLKNVAGGTVDAGKRVVSGTADAGRKVVGGTADAGKRVVSGTADAGRKVAGATTDVAKSGGGLLKKLLPLLLLLLLGAIAFPYLRGCGKTAVDTTTSAASGVVEGTKNVAGKAANATKNAAGAVVDGTKNAAGAVVDGTKNAAGAVVDGTKNAAGAVGNAAGNVVEGTKNAAGKVVEGTKNAAGAVGGAVASAAQKGADFFKFAKGSTEAKFANFLTQTGGNLNQAFVLDKVEFETGSANLKPASRAQLDNMVKVLKANPNVHIETQGHTDNTGNASKNKTLSQQRANAVKSYLQSKGVQANRMTAKGFGSENPRAKNDTPQGRQKNRRTELRVTKK